MSRLHHSALPLDIEVLTSTCKGKWSWRGFYDQRPRSFSEIPNVPVYHSSRHPICSLTPAAMWHVEVQHQHLWLAASTRDRIFNSVSHSRSRSQSEVLRAAEEGRKAGTHKATAGHVVLANFPFGFCSGAEAWQLFALAGQSSSSSNVPNSQSLRLISDLNGNSVSNTVTGKMTKPLCHKTSRMYLSTTGSTVTWKSFLPAFI